MKKKTLRGIAILSMVLSLALTGGIFAYWASSVSGDDTIYTPKIDIDKGGVATTILSLDDLTQTTGNLVPTGYANVGDGTVESISITYNVYLREGVLNNGSKGAVANLAITVGAIVGDTCGLINVTPPVDTSITVGDASPVVITIVITLTEPANEEQYDTVAGLSFNIPITFTATIPA